MPDSTFVIAEMACSHEGDPALARVIIDGAVTAGADAIQFQIWDHRTMVVPDHPDAEVLRRIELSHDEWTSLAEYARSRNPGMEIIACIYDRPSVDFAASIGVDAFKIHTADLANPTLIRHVAAIGKRIDLSVGASTVAEISNALAWIEEAGGCEVWLMYGQQLFPTEISDAQIASAAALAELFQLPVGYQDHSDAETEAAFWLPAAARGMGIWIQEKHVTHDRSKKGIDHQAALNPDEFGRFVSMLRGIDAACGDGVPRPFTPAQEKYRTYSKKSIVALRELSAGSTITEDDLGFRRTTTLGAPPSELEHLVGKSLRADVPAYGLVQREDVE